MNLTLFYTMALTVAANIAYHFCQKGISGNANPWISLFATYIVAILVTLLAYVLFGRTEPGAGLFEVEGWARLNWASYGLGVAAVGLELGFLWVYRAGWRLSIAALYSNAMVTLALIPIGLLFFHEGFSIRRGAGILLALSGLWVLSGV